MVSFYKHDIPLWMDGTENLSHEAYRVYHVVCQLIYLAEEPIALNERGIAGRCNMSVRAFLKGLQELINYGKITLENGRISNSRAVFELEIIENNRENAKTGGINSGIARNLKRKSLKNNEPIEVLLQEDRSLKEKTREDKTREERVSPVDKQPAAKKRKSYPREFEDFWHAYPSREGMSKTEAFEKWQRLPPEEHSAAIAALPAYKKHLEANPWKQVVDACRFLSKKRFEGFEDVPSTPAMPEGLTPEQIQDWKGGWRPGMPSSRELNERRGKNVQGSGPDETASMVAASDRLRENKQELVHGQVRNSGPQRLGSILSRIGLDSAVLSAAGAGTGMHAPVRAAGMDDNRSATKDEAEL